MNEHNKCTNILGMGLEHHKAERATNHLGETRQATSNIALGAIKRSYMDKELYINLLNGGTKGTSNRKESTMEPFIHV